MKRQSFFRLVGALGATLLVLGACSSSGESPTQLGFADQDRPAEELTPDTEIVPDRASHEMAPDQLAMVATYPGDLAEEMAVSIGSREPGQSVLAAIATVESARASSDDDEGTHNESGGLVVLDPRVLQACGNAEIALVLAQEADEEALVHLVAAAELVRSSEIEWPDAWGDILEDTVLRGADTELAPLVAFLSLCVAGGYEL